MGKEKTWTHYASRCVLRTKLIDIKPRKCSYFLALRGVMLNGGPGGPKDFGKMSTHICNRPWVLINEITQ